MSAVDGAKRRRWRRVFLRRRRDAVELGQQADQQIERLLLRRFDRLLSVKRFVILWVLLFVLLLVATVFQIRALSSYYQSLQPVPGGIYSEGLVGKFSNANPIYAASSVDLALSHLTFSGLLKYDKQNQLTGDLAESWSQGPAPTHYTVRLKEGVQWHDGKFFSADDVVFTYKTIQNIQSQSPLYNSWQDIKVSKQDDFTVNFDLPNAISSFPYTLTNGILPEHLLKQTPPSELRSASFNVNPVGTGPFSWKFLEIIGTPGKDFQQRISLTAFNHYFGGQPKLDGFNIIAFFDEQQAFDAFKKKQVNALAGLEAIAPELSKDKSVQVYTTPVTSAVMAFFNTSRSILGELNVRRALVSGIDRLQLVNLNSHSVKLVDSPLLRGQLGYDPAVVEPPFDEARANQLLDEAGWVRGPQGYRLKNGQVLQLRLHSQNTREYTLTSQYLQVKWGELGIKLDAQYHDSDDLQGSIIANHDYDILVYAINIGVDPDVFAYWDSSQASISSQGHLNLSEYKSTTADQALEGARTRSDPDLRSIKLKPFLSSWVNDAPALALYQPNFLYITRGPVFDYERQATNSSADRFYNVNNWMIRTERQTID